MTILYYSTFEEKLPEDFFKEKLNSLPLCFREKTEKFWRWQDAYASLFGKFLLLEGFRNFGISACLSDLRFTNYGKPYIPDSSVCFNISHSGHCVVCVMSDEVDSIGVDVEEIKPINLKGLRNCWTNPEWSEIVNGTPTVFFTYWTRKEAVLKADGRGLGVPLKKIEVRETQVNLNDKIYFLSVCKFHPNYILHVASIKDFTQPDHAGVRLQHVPILN